MNIVKADINDTEEIRILAETIWPVAYQHILSDQQLQFMLTKFYGDQALKTQILTDGHQFFLIKNEQQIPLGFASVSETDESKFKLHKLYVLPNYQKKNLGKALLECIIAYSKERGGKSLVLNVNRNNNARFFYLKQGFKIIQEIDIPIGNNFFMNDFIMERNL